MLQAVSRQELPQHLLLLFLMPQVATNNYKHQSRIKKNPKTCLKSRIMKTLLKQSPSKPWHCFQDFGCYASVWWAWWRGLLYKLLKTKVGRKPGDWGYYDTSSTRLWWQPQTMRLASRPVVGQRCAGSKRTTADQLGLEAQHRSWPGLIAPSIFSFLC